jgi:hypothetical protein
MQDERDDDEGARDGSRRGTQLGEHKRLASVGLRDGHGLRLLRLIDYRRRWIRIVWPDGRRLERLRRSATIGVVVLAQRGDAVVALQGDEALSAWELRLP